MPSKIGEMTDDVRVGELQLHMKEFKRLLEPMCTHCETGLYAVKFSLIGHTVEDLERFGYLKLLEAVLEVSNAHNATIQDPVSAARLGYGVSS